MTGRQQYRAFTLVELLVVIAIISIIVAFTLPAINASREIARQKQCEHKLMSLAFAFEDFESSQGHLPAGVDDPGDVIRNVPESKHHSWVLPLLPYLSESLLDEKVDRSASTYAPSNAEARTITLYSLLCPVGDRPEDGIGHSDFAGVHHDVEAPLATDNQGVLFVRSQIRSNDIRDGRGYTLLLGEKITERGDLGWMSGTRATLRNTGTPLNQTGVVRPPQTLINSGDGISYEIWSESDQAKVVVEALAGEEPNDPEVDEGADNTEESPPQAEDNTDREDMTGGEWTGAVEAGSGPARVPTAVEDPSDPRPPSGEEDGESDERQLRMVGGFGSNHPRGAVFVFADGNMRFLTTEIDDKFYRQLGNRQDGTLLDLQQLE